MDFKHIPIMLEEVIEGLKIKENGIYIDATIGGGGHSLEIIKRLREGKLIGIDQDQEALNKAQQTLEDYKENLLLVHSNFENVDLILADLGISQVDGILMDIGVSSYQLDKAERGFSHNFDSRLDMRMDTSQSFAAWDLVNSYSEEDLERIILSYGEESWARRIAKFIVEARQVKAIDSTLDLVEIIKKAIPKRVRMQGGHPAKKTFQAIRIEVNRELDVLEKTIEKMVSLLKEGGRIGIITFHSLEDRIVKETFRYLERDCICPPQLPQCVCQKKKEIKLVSRKPIVASEEEREANPRSRSAKLRIAEKL